jgi:amino acid transporter
MRFPAADVFRVGLGSELLPRVVLIAGFFGLLAVWNAVLMGASRLLFALGRARIIHPNFAGVTSEGVPVMATVFVGVCCTLGILLGRRALIPILTVVSASQAAAFLLVSLAVIKLRRERPDLPRPYRVPGGVVTAGLAALGSAVAVGLAVYEPYRAAGKVPLEWWLVLGWSVLGAFFWAGSRAVRQAVPETERRLLILGDGDRP